MTKLIRVVEVVLTPLIQLRSNDMIVSKLLSPRILSLACN